MTIYIVLGIVVVVAVALWYGGLRWRGHTAEVREQLRRGLRPAIAAQFHASDVDSLPEPVRRYFLHVLKEGQPIIRTATITTEGEFAMGGRQNSWKPFHAEQLFTTQPAGFDWDARIRIIPGINVFVRDAYVARNGILNAKVIGLFTVADAEQSKELAEGELLRYLAESAWLPTALLPSQGVVWQGIDDSTAIATLTDGAISVSLTFTFNPQGEIIRAYTPARPRMEGNGPAAWSATYGQYGEQQGVLVPLQSEVRWELPDGIFPYWRGKITGVIYNH